MVVRELCAHQTLDEIRNLQEWYFFGHKCVWLTKIFPNSISFKLHRNICLTICLL